MAASTSACAFAAASLALPHFWAALATRATAPAGRSGPVGEVARAARSPAISSAISLRRSAASRCFSARRAAASASSACWNAVSASSRAFASRSKLRQVAQRARRRALQPGFALVAVVLRPPAMKAATWPDAASAVDSPERPEARRAGTGRGRPGLGDLAAALAQDDVVQREARPIGLAIQPEQPARHAMVGNDVAVGVGQRPGGGGGPPQGLAAVGRLDLGADEEIPPVEAEGCGASAWKRKRRSPTINPQPDAAVPGRAVRVGVVVEARPGRRFCSA